MEVRVSVNSFRRCSQCKTQIVRTDTGGLPVNSNNELKQRGCEAIAHLVSYDKDILLSF